MFNCSCYLLCYFLYPFNYSSYLLFSQHIQDLIAPAVTVDIVEFINRHIEHDLLLICKVLNKNEDDAKLSIHILLKKLLKNTNKNSKFLSCFIFEIQSGYISSTTLPGLTFWHILEFVRSKRNRRTKHNLSFSFRHHIIYTEKYLLTWLNCFEYNSSFRLVWYKNHFFVCWYFRCNESRTTEKQRWKR